MNGPRPEAVIRAEDEQLLHEAGYQQELARRMGAFSNFAISMSTICILAGGLTSFHVGLCSVGGAAVGIGWPVACLFSLVVAATMAQVASAFPTAGGPYHWAAILGGKAWGWATACFNLAGLITVLAAINVGACRFVVSALSQQLDTNPLSCYLGRRSCCHPVRAGHLLRGGRRYLCRLSLHLLCTADGPGTVGLWSDMDAPRAVALGLVVSPAGGSERIRLWSADRDRRAATQRHRCLDCRRQRCGAGDLVAGLCAAPLCRTAARHLALLRNAEFEKE
jgi:hypothetical protein